MISRRAGNSQAMTVGVIVSSFPESWLKRPRNAHAVKTAINAATAVTNIDSVRNWATRYLRGEPSTLRTPTSRARLADRAVERFIKLTQAMSRTKRAMAEKI